MNIDFSPLCKKKLASLKTKNIVLFNKTTKQLKLFQLQPDHPSLRLHKLSGILQDTWSILLKQGGWNTLLLKQLVR
jgi:hypothetical protein